MSDDNEALVRSAYEAMRTGDLKGFFAVFDEQVVLHEPDPLPHGGTYHGLAGLQEMLPKAAEVLDPSKLAVDGLFAAGDEVVALIRIGVRGGPDARLVEHWRLRDGKAVEVRVYWFDPTQAVAAGS